MFFSLQFIIYELNKILSLIVHQVGSVIDNDSYFMDKDNIYG